MSQRMLMLFAPLVVMSILVMRPVHIFATEPENVQEYWDFTQSVVLETTDGLDVESDKYLEKLDIGSYPASGDDFFFYGFLKAPFDFSEMEKYSARPLSLVSDDEDLTWENFSTDKTSISFSKQGEMLENAFPLQTNISETEDSLNSIFFGNDSDVLEILIPAEKKIKLGNALDSNDFVMVTNSHLQDMFQLGTLSKHEKDNWEKRKILKAILEKYGQPWYVVQHPSATVYARYELIWEVGDAAFSVQFDVVNETNEIRESKFLGKYFGDGAWNIYKEKLNAEAVIIASLL